MTSREVAFENVDRVADDTVERAEAFHMDEDAFRAFYDRTSRTVWAYLARITGDRGLADDLLQDTYYRFLCARVEFESEQHRRNYLFRIATNLVHDRRRRRSVEPPTVGVEEGAAVHSGADEAQRHQRNTDVRRALTRMTPRDREMLWLAYAEGLSHQDIATAVNVAVGSVKVMLHRAKSRMRRLLGAVGGNREEEQ